MKQISSIIFFLTTFVSLSGAVTLYSINDGNWQDGNVWAYDRDLTPCGCYPKADDNAYIFNHVTMDASLTNGPRNLGGISGLVSIDSIGFLDGGSSYDIEVRSGGTLIICGRLAVRDLIFDNGSLVTICTSGNATVNGDFKNRNNSNEVEINGTFTVNGAFITGNRSLITGTGTIIIPTGPINNMGGIFGCVGYNPCTSLPCTIKSPCAVILPVKLISFNAERNADNTVSLKWITATEINNDRFEIERTTSSDRNASFEFVGSITGNGNSVSEKLYAFRDAEAPMTAALFYRLKQVDYDGKFTYSDIQSVSMEREKFSVFPNPVTDNVFYIVVPASTSATVQIVNGGGQLVFSKPLQTGNEFAVMKESLDLAPGMYFVRFDTGVKVENERLIVGN